MSRKTSNFPANTALPADTVISFVSGGVNYVITLADFLAALNVTGSLAQDGDSGGTPILDTQGTVHNIRNLEIGANSGLQASISAENGVTLALNAQVSAGTGSPVLDGSNKIRNIKAGAGCSVAVVGDDIVISVP